MSPTKSVRLDVRFGSEHEPWEFITPCQCEVQKVLSLLPQGSEWAKVHWCWDWVCRNVQYPLDARGNPTDRHVLQAFVVVEPIFLGTHYRLRRVTEEFWQYPPETLAWGYGDCEDTSILLCSLLRNFVSHDRVRVAVGNAGFWDHAWVELDSYILETSLTAAPDQPDHYPSKGYRPLGWFNDKMVSGDFSMLRGRNERAKLKWLGTYWSRPTKL